MAIPNQAQRLARHSGPGAFGPMATFAGTLIIAFVAWAVAAMMMPKDFALATVSSLFFAFAAVVALVAWRLRRPTEATLTYWDVAGALTLIGICAATLMDSDQLVRFIESQRQLIAEID